MPIVRIDKQNLVYDLATFDSMMMTRLQAEILYKFLMSMGAASNMSLELRLARKNSKRGYVWVSTTFKYPSKVWSEKKQTYVDGFAEGTQITPLSTYLKKLIRFDKSQHKRLKNVENKINGMYQIISGAAKQLKA
jgi:hypothetical protein